MKTQHQLPNGTLLEVGKKYRLEEWEKDYFVELIAFREQYIFCREDNNQEGCYVINRNWLPYEPEQTKELAGYQEFYVLFDNGIIYTCFAKNKEAIKEKVTNITKIYTRKEAASAGLPV